MSLLPLSTATTTATTIGWNNSAYRFFDKSHEHDVDFGVDIGVNISLEGDNRAAAGGGFDNEYKIRRLC